MTSQSNPTLHALSRLSGRFDQQAGQINEFTRQQAEGENPDPAMFMDLLQQRSVTQQAMEAQLKLHEKPLRNILNDAK